MPWTATLQLLLSVSCPIFTVYFHFKCEEDDSRFPWTHEPHLASDMSGHRRLHSENMDSTKSRNKSKEPLCRTLSNSTKRKVMKLLKYYIWGRISAHGELLKTWVNFYTDLKEFSLVRLCLILNSADFIVLRKKKEKEVSKLHIAIGNENPTRTLFLQLEVYPLNYHSLEFVLWVSFYKMNEKKVILLS